MSAASLALAETARKLRGRRGWNVSIAAHRGDEGWTEGSSDAIYEIASVTKTFMGTLLADFAQRGSVGLDASVASLLPWASPELTMSLAQLANHTSGLPLLPQNFRKHLRARSNPFADYDEAALREALARERPVRAPNRRHVYTNYGFAVLGHVLSHAGGANLATLVRERICAPLALSDTSFCIDDTLRSRCVTGHDARGRPVPPWTFGVFEAAGGLHSTSRDLLTFLRAQISLEAPLASAFERARRPTWQSRGFAVGLGWFLSPLDGRELVWHSGANAGFASYTGFIPDARIGVVILVNHGLSLWGAFVDNPIERAASRLLRALLNL